MIDGRIRALPRSAAVLKTSRSSFAKPACWNTPDATDLFIVLRLVHLHTAALHSYCVRGQSARMRPTARRS